MTRNLNLLLAAFACASAVLVHAYPNPLSGSDDVVLRDPAIWYNPDLKEYSVFSTGAGIRIFTSGSLTGPWTSAGTVLPNNCSIIEHPGQCTPWAPDVNFIGDPGLYTLYYAVSQISSGNSAIGVATSPSMKAGTWTDLGMVISTKDGDDSNAIDANVIQSDPGLRMSYGSWNSGMYQVALGPAVNQSSTSLPGTHLAGNTGRPAEGGFLYKPSSQPYYYFFFSDGITPLADPSTPRPAPGDEYKIRVGRGENVDGPFRDADGHALTLDRDPPTGTLVLKSHDNVYAPGGQSIFLDPASKRDVMVYHYVKLNDPVGGPSYLGVNYLDFASGWPVVVD